MECPLQEALQTIVHVSPVSRAPVGHQWQRLNISAHKQRRFSCGYSSALVGHDVTKHVRNSHAEASDIRTIGQYCFMRLALSTLHFTVEKGSPRYQDMHPGLACNTAHAKYDGLSAWYRWSPCSSYRRGTSAASKRQLLAVCCCAVTEHSQGAQQLVAAAADDAKPGQSCRS